MSQRGAGAQACDKGGKSEAMEGVSIDMDTTLEGTAAVVEMTAVTMAKSIVSVSVGLRRGM